MKAKIIIIIIGISMFGWASTLSAKDLVEFRNVLFAKVINVAEDDMLNIRSEPDYTSSKIGDVYPSSILGVDICQKNSKSTWCKISILTNLEETETGWVNAKFLDLVWERGHRGYVKIIGRPNLCYYVIKCEIKAESQMCMIANSDFLIPTDKASSKSTIEWVDRDKLTAGTSFDSAPADADGYCINGLKINDYYK